MSEPTTFDTWAILELMGHVRLAGRVTEEERFGAKMGRIDIPHDEGDGFTTQYFGGGSIYRLTACTEEAARLVAKQTQPEPVHRWELPVARQLEATTIRGHEVDTDFDRDTTDDDGNDV